MGKLENAGFKRRDFLKGVGSAALAAGFIGLQSGEALAKKPANTPANGLPDELLPFPKVSANPNSEGFWNQVAKAFVLPDDFIHMNTGTTGSQPLFSQNNLAVYNNYKSRDPRDWQLNLNADYPDLFPILAGSTSGLSARQAAIAAAYGANPAEIVLSYDTTDACNLIFSGTPWKGGDRIITTTFEHNAMVGPIAFVRDYLGVEVAVIELPANFTSAITVAEVLSWFEAELAKPLPMGAKQYVAFSEIFYKNGLRMPVKEICTLARNYGAYSIVDSAHAWGQLPVNCHDYAADFIAGAGHKWLCGGPGTGIFYVRNSGSNLPPFAMGNFAAYGNLFTIPSANHDSRSWSPGTTMQSRGETNTPALYAMADSFNYFNAVGLQNIYQRGVALSDYLKQKIESKWGPGALWVQRNSDFAFKTFLTSFNPFKGRGDASQFAAMNSAITTILNNLAAETPKINIRSVTFRTKRTDQADNRVAFRISTHAMYNNYSQIDYMFDRLVAQINASGLPQL